MLHVTIASDAPIAVPLLDTTRSLADLKQRVADVCVGVVEGLFDVVTHGTVLDSDDAVAMLQYGEEVELIPNERALALQSLSAQHIEVCNEAVHDAIQDDNAEVLTLLLSADSSLIDCFDGYATPLQRACKVPAPNAVSVLLNHTEAANSLFHCIETSCAELLLSAGASPNENTAVLHNAILNGSTALCNLLLSKGADVHSSRLGESPILLAARLHRHDVVSLLLHYGADLITPEVYLKDPALCRVLLRAGSLVPGEIEDTSVNKAWGAVLMGAVEKGSEEVVDIVLEGAGGAVDCRDADGMTPLMHAVLRGDVGVVRALLAAGADVGVRDAAGLTALSLAEEVLEDRVLARVLRAQVSGP